MFDQTSPVVISEDSHGKTIKDIPITYTNNGTKQSTCSLEEIEYTNGQILYSGSVYTLQESCKPDTGNAGNYYNWSTGTTGGVSIQNGYNEPNSICSIGWRLPKNDMSDTKSFYNLVNNNYNATTPDDAINIPFSFVRSGIYYTKISERLSSGNFWTSTAKDTTDAFYLSINSSSITVQNKYFKSYGRSVRCVSR